MKTGGKKLYKHGLQYSLSKETSLHVYFGASLNKLLNYAALCSDKAKNEHTLKED